MPPRDSSSQATIEEISRRIAIRCRRVIQSCLREDEWRLADEEFANVAQEVIREEMARLPEHR